MAKSFATLKAETLQALQDVSVAVWNNADNPTEIEDRIEKAILEVSDYQPYIMMTRFTIESRTGTATSTTANKLVDPSAHYGVSASEYPDFNQRKGIRVVLTPAQENMVKNFARDVVYPQILANEGI